MATTYLLVMESSTGRHRIVKADDVVLDESGQPFETRPSLTEVLTEGNDAENQSILNVSSISGSGSITGFSTAVIGAAASLTNGGDVQMLGTGVLAMKETTTPTPDTNYGKLYCKNDNVLYFQDGAGVEHNVLLDAAGDFADGGEAGGAARSLGNTDAYSLSLLTSGVAQLTIDAAGDITMPGTLSATGYVSATSGFDIGAAAASGSLYPGGAGVVTAYALTNFDFSSSGKVTLPTNTDTASTGYITFGGSIANVIGGIAGANTMLVGGANTVTLDAGGGTDTLVLDALGNTMAITLGSAVAATFSTTSLEVADGYYLSFGGAYIYSGGGSLFIGDNAFDVRITASNLIMDTNYISSGGAATMSFSDPDVIFGGDVVVSTGQGIFESGKSVGVTFDGSGVNITGNYLAMPAGTVYAPGLIFSSTTTGLYESGSDQIAISCYGQQVADFGNSRIDFLKQLYFSSTGSTSAPTIALSSTNGTGIYSSTADHVSVTAYGTQVMDFESSKATFYQPLSTALTGSTSSPVIAFGSNGSGLYSSAADHISISSYGSQIADFHLDAVGFYKATNIAVSGTVSAPALTINSATTGLYLVGSDLAVSAYGVLSAQFGSSAVVLAQNTTIGAGAAGVDYTLTFNGENNDGVLAWMEDEDYFQFNDNVLFDTDRTLYFRNTNNSIVASGVGTLVIRANSEARTSIGGTTMLSVAAAGVTIGGGAAATDYTLTFNGETNDGVLTWMEDEDYFRFEDNVFMNATTLYLSSATESISGAGGVVTIAAATSISAGANLLIGGNSIGNDGAALSFANTAGGHHATFAGNVYLGANGIGYDTAALSFATTTGHATFAGNVYLGANGIGYDTAALSFATTTGHATFAGNVYLGGTGLVQTSTATELELGANSTSYLFVSTAGSVVLGAKAALGTTATDGFTYIPTCAGAPTGTPTSVTGKVALVFDTTNNDLYVYDGSWIKVALA